MDCYCHRNSTAVTNGQKSGDECEGSTVCIKNGARAPPPTPPPHHTRTHTLKELLDFVDVVLKVVADGGEEVVVGVQVRDDLIAVVEVVGAMMVHIVHGRLHTHTHTCSEVI